MNENADGSGTPVVVEISFAGLPAGAQSGNEMTTRYSMPTAKPFNDVRGQAGPRQCGRNLQPGGHADAKLYLV